MGPGDALSEVLVFSNGSFAFSGYYLYLVTADKKGKETMHLIKSRGKTHNGLVPVAEHTIKTLGINTLYGILSVIHHPFGESNIKFIFIGDSLCSAKLYREGVKCTLKIITNTRVQKDQLMQLSKSFKNSTVTLYWVPYAAKKADVLTKISKTSVKVDNGSKYRNGTFRPGVEYIQLHNKFHEGNWYYKVKEICCQKAW